ncbi:MAG: ABC transporter permease [Maricaulaceae bacterium]
MMPAMNMRRSLLIAKRDYMGYIKTWGFWISFCFPIFGLGFGLLASNLNLDFDPVRYETILDETGDHGANILARHEAKLLREQHAALHAIADVMLPDDKFNGLHAVYGASGYEAAMAHLKEINPSIAEQIKPIEHKVIFVKPPAKSLEALRPYLRGDSLMTYGDQQVALNGVLIIRDKEPAEAEYWSAQINAQHVKSLARGYFRGEAESRYLESGSLSKVGLDTARSNAPRVKAFDPTKVVRKKGESQAVTQADRAPYLVAAIMSVFLWLSVFSGAYMLLTSMLEEKLNKLLEMMLATTRFSEIIFGKLIGVAALTLTAMLPYILLGVVGALFVIIAGPAELSYAMRNAFTLKLMIFFPIFLVLGYVFYGSFFIALGALSNSMQDAQTITTPIVMVLTLCIMVVPLGINSPDSPLLTFASWFPLSAPFAAIMRLPSDPPMWELALSAFFLAVLAIGVVWLAGRIFRYGVLSGSGVKGVTDWIKRAIFRRKA